MNENLNLVEILKDCPKGTKFYSSIYGELIYSYTYVSPSGAKFVFILPNSNSMFNNIPIKVEYCWNGKYIINMGECTLFPSKDQRDWSKFKQLVKPKFKVGDKIVNILGKRMGASGSYGIISEITDDKYIFTDTSYAFIRNQDGWELVPDKKPKFDPNTLKPFDKVLVREGFEWHCNLFSHRVFDGYAHIDGCTYGYCIPYNDDTKHLVGTTKEAPEYYRYWED